MKKILDFLSGKRYLIIWTLCYIFVLWAILYCLFNFSIFNLSQWHRLIHAQLYGFAGFVFGLLILAAGPLYIATSVLIIRKNKPLITIPLPKIPKINFISKTAQKEPEPEPAPEQNVPESKPDENLNDDIPPEMLPMFARAKLHPIKFIKTQNQSENIDIVSDTSPLPLPSDFDISIDDEFDSIDTNSDTDAPVFTELNFDDNDTTDKINSDLSRYLDDKSIEYMIQDNIVITPDMAIITHDDPDFWVPDDENWFATGKSVPSPIHTITSIASAHNVKPVIYLAETNIMDIETLIPQWESNGITVVTNLADL